MAKLDPLMSSQSIEWETPDEFFKNLDSVYKFTLDVCSTHENAKCKLHYTKEDDGLAQAWSGVCWMNPPYGREIKAWMRKAYEESFKGVKVVCLVPARTDTAWWHDYAAKGTVCFIRGRLRFKGAASSAPFPSAIVIFN